MTSQRIGFIGVGLMGHGMARNLVEKGHPLSVLGHRNRAPVDDLLARGAREAASAADLARDSDIVFICVTGSPQVEDVVFRPGGLLEGVREGLIVCDCSTADPASTLRVAEAIGARGGRFADTPLTRTPKEAEEGRLSVMVGGSAELLEEIRPVLDCFAEEIRHAGPTGAGHRLKLVNNFIALGTAAVIAEGIATALKGGVDLEALVAVTTSGGADGVMLRRFAKVLLERDESVLRFTIANAAKDLGYYSAMARGTPATAFIAEAVHQTFLLARIMGYEDRYVPRMVDMMAELNRPKR